MSGLVSEIAQILEPWAWETKSWNATMARDEATAKAEQIVALFATTPPTTNDAKSSTYQSAADCPLGSAHGSASTFGDADGIDCCDFCGFPADDQPTTNDAIPAGEADEAHRLACVLRIAQASSNEHGEDMIRAAGMLDRLIYLPAFTRRPPEQAVTVPAGWKLVPETNTPEMCEAYEDLYLTYGDGPPVETVWTAMLSAAPSAPATEAEEGNAFRPMEAWDQRDEPVMLLVDYRGDGDHPLEDANFAITVGHNNDHNVGEDEGTGWHFAGWCWSHDHYVEGRGKPVGWMPLPHILARAYAAFDGESATPTDQVKDQ